MITGTCLCGVISLEIDEPLEKAPEACHCSQCRKQTGNFFVGVNVQRSALRVHGDERVTYKPTDASRQTTAACRSACAATHAPNASKASGLAK
jgi:hypothetical protein